MNDIASQIVPASAARPSDGPVSQSPAAKDLMSASSRKSFSSVLRTVRQAQRSARPAKPGDDQSQTTSHSKVRIDRYRTAGHENSRVQESRDHTSQAHTSETLPPDSPDERNEALPDSPHEVRTATAVESSAEAAPQRLLMPVLPQSVSDTGTEEADTAQTDVTQDIVLPFTTHDGSTAPHSVPVFPIRPATNSPEEPLTAAHNLALYRSAPEAMTEFSPQPILKEGIDSVPHQEINSTSPHSDGPDPGRAGQDQHGHHDVAGRPLPIQAEYVPIQQSNDFPEQESLLPHTLMEQDRASSHFSRMTDGMSGATQIERPAALPPGTSTQALSSHAIEDPQGESILALNWQQLSDSEPGADMQSMDHGDHQQKQGDTVWFDRPSRVDQNSNTINGNLSESFMVGNASQAMPRQADAPSGAMFSQAQAPAASAPTGELPAQAMPRSVVFEVAQPDLGRINIRVAMSNDLVHTRLSSDRPEVGQFLINGQDRLQTALQANGLELGQFRVDIDRHSAGRSFHHEQQPEQGRNWEHPSSGSERDHHPSESHDSRRTRSHGMLNLVA